MSSGKSNIEKKKSKNNEQLHEKEKRSASEKLDFLLELNSLEGALLRQLKRDLKERQVI
jgi:hypothetical protein